MTPRRRGKEQTRAEPAWTHFPWMPMPMQFVKFLNPVADCKCSDSDRVNKKPTICVSLDTSSASDVHLVFHRLGLWLSITAKVSGFCPSYIVGKYGSMDSESRRTSKLHDPLKKYDDWLGLLWSWNSLLWIMGELAGEGLGLLALVTGVRRNVIFDMWHVTCDMWHVTCHMSHVTHDF